MKSLFARYEGERLIGVEFSYKDFGIPYYKFNDERFKTKKHRIYRIDLTPKHDIFYEEDLDFIRREQPFTNKEKALMSGLSERNYYRERRSLVSLRTL